VGKVKKRLETLLKAGVLCIIITGTNFNNINNQFCKKVNPKLKKNLYVCCNRGSEVFGFDKKGEKILLYRRKATINENAIMNKISCEIKDWLARDYNLNVEIIFNRFNRRKLDLIPIEKWSNPKKEKIGELLIAVEKRLSNSKVEGGIKKVINEVYKKAKKSNINLKITTDVKHIELGLTDKSDSVNFIINEIAKKSGILNEDTLFIGDEFGPIGEFEGSDFKMFSKEAEGALYISVGKEPCGVPEGVILYGGQILGFREILDKQIALIRKFKK
jgi:hydroxymethylpyrimidine pyrophosphatase-like HAD family hydrolase